MWRQEAQKPYLDAVNFAHRIPRHTAERLSRLAIDDVECKPCEARYARPLAQDVWAEVEFVVAEYRIIQPERIPGGDHLCPFEEVRCHRRRDGIAGEQEERVRRFGHDLLAQRRHAGQSAAPTLV